MGSEIVSKLRFCTWRKRIKWFIFKYNWMMDAALTPT